jgi:hypothetical protein
MEKTEIQLPGNKDIEKLILEEINYIKNRI